MSQKVDVIIVGAGPVGLLIAYQLAKFGCKPYIIEQEDKSLLPVYGRACTLWPRTMELLDQLGLAEDMLQVGIVSTNSMHFRAGKRLTGGYMYATRMDKLGDTAHKYAFHLRQRIIEQQFEAALLDHRFPVHKLNSLQSYTIDESSADGYPVTARISNLSSSNPNSESTYEIKAKYLIGADGGKSLVRKLAHIPFPGDRSAYQWVRLDALLTTDMPSPRYLNSIDSPTHGQILWCPIDNGFTRIGYVFSEELMRKYGVNGTEGFTKEVAMYEAEQAVKPWKIEWLSVDWFVLYGIGQRIADTFFSQKRIFLAGDACHTHSSGSAQGLNTGIHDAVNLSWKLSLCLRGLAAPSLLDSYEEERRPIVQQVIDNDKTISKLISGAYPPRFEGRKELPRDILTEWFSDMNMQAFTLGLGITYPLTRLNMPGEVSLRATINPGDRAPDAQLVSIGTGDSIRLHTILKNEAKFHVLVFAGSPHLTKHALQTLHHALTAAESHPDPNSDTYGNQLEDPELKPLTNPELFTWTTIVGSSTSSSFDALGISSSHIQTPSSPSPYPSQPRAAQLQSTIPRRPEGGRTTMAICMGTRNHTRNGAGVLHGRLFLDPTTETHTLYGVDPSLGAVVFVRPDGWVSAVCGADVEGVRGVGRWVGGLVSLSEGGGDTYTYGGRGRERERVLGKL